MQFTYLKNVTLGSTKAFWEIVFYTLYFELFFQCMRRFIEDTDPYKVQQKLLCALEKSGRRDLKEEVEEILNRRA
jgi:hypothetical protein